jgi:hypothetical protein
MRYTLARCDKCSTITVTVTHFDLQPLSAATVQGGGTLAAALQMQQSCTLHLQGNGTVIDNKNG